MIGRGLFKSVLYCQKGSRFGEAKCWSIDCFAKNARNDTKNKIARNDTKNKIACNDMDEWRFERLLRKDRSQ